MNPLETPNLTLIPCTIHLLETAVKGNAQLAKFLGIKVPAGWTEFGSRALKYALERLKESRQEEGWWTYLPIHRQNNELIGSCGFKGRPDAQGLVEIGYEISKPYRGRGLATEVAGALARHAFSHPGVQAVRAHTLAEENASARVLAKCGFTRIEIPGSSENVKLWRWELRKS